MCVLAACIAASASARAARHTDSALDAVPTGLKPTTTHLSQILALHKDDGALTTVIEDWAFTDTGVSGTEHLERSGENYRSRIVTGPISNAYGQLDGKRWHQDANGITMTTSDIDDISFTAIRVREDAADPKNDVSVAGETSGAAPAYVLRVKRDGYRHPEWIYYDASTGDIVRVDYVAGKHRVSERYDDFRTVDGVRQAWHVHDAYDDPTFDDDWHLTAFHGQSASLPSTDFAPPPNAPHISTVASGALLQGQITDDGATIVRLTIGGRGVDFELDSSAPKSYIDMGLADDLHLPDFGHARRLHDGTRLAFDTVLPDADAGPIHFHNLTLLATDVAYRPNPHTRVVGILGYDFFAANVLHVNYVNRTLEVLPANRVVGEHPIAGALELPLTLDNGVPYVPMMIGDAITKNVVLGSDLPYTMVFGPYLEAHASQFVTPNGQHPYVASVPFADESSYGQKIHIYLTRTPTLRFANADYSNLAIIGTNFPYDPYGRNVDAIIGLDYLSYFDLYFDFPHGRMFVQPNMWFYRTFNKDKHA